MMEERDLAFVCGHPQSQEMPPIPPKKAFATIWKVVQTFFTLRFPILGNVINE